ncbi:MAG: hypothetical protein JO180_03015 [Gemmatirosa sp.]|nr:hypothetical protein [Gemmatirosa sp.]
MASTSATTDTSAWVRVRAASAPRVRRGLAVRVVDDALVADALVEAESGADAVRVVSARGCDAKAASTLPAALSTTGRRASGAQAARHAATIQPQRVLRRASGIGDRDGDLVGRSVAREM